MSLHVENFSNKVRIMNQTQSKNLMMSADDARNLQSEIFDLLAKIAEIALAKKQPEQQASVSLELDGGKFR